jgi:hypothetical protein
LPTYGYRIKIFWWFGTFIVYKLPIFCTLWSRENCMRWIISLIWVRAPLDFFVIEFSHYTSLSHDHALYCIK